MLCIVVMNLDGFQILLDDTGERLLLYMYVYGCVFSFDILLRQLLFSVASLWFVREMLNA